MLEARRLKKAGSLALGSSMLLMGMVPAASAFAATTNRYIVSVTTTVSGDTATASSVSNPTGLHVWYQFRVETAAGHWFIAQRFSPSDQYTFVPPADATGIWHIEAYALTQYQVAHKMWNLAVSSTAQPLEPVVSKVVIEGAPSSSPTNLVLNPSGASGSTNGWDLAYSGQDATISATTVNNAPALEWTVTSAIGHSDWVSYYPDVTNGDTYTFTVTLSGSGQAQLNVWNGDENIPAQLLTLSSTPQTETLTVTIPGNAPGGQTASAPQLQVVTPGTANATVYIQNASVTQQSSSDLAPNNIITLTAVPYNSANSAITDITSPAVWSVTTSSGAATTGAAVTALAATDQAIFDATAPGDYTVTATIDGVTGTASVDVYGPAAKVVLTPTQPTVVADGAASDTITARVYDINGNPVTNFAGTAEVVLSGIGDVTANTGVVTFSDGVGTFTVSGTDTGTETISLADLTPSDGSEVASTVAYSATSVTFTTPSPTSLMISPTTSSMLATPGASETVSVNLLDQDGNAIPMHFANGFDIVTMTLTGPGSFAPNSTVTSTTTYVADGLPADVPVYDPTGQPGSIVVAASASGLTQAVARITAEQVGLPAQISVTSSTASTSAALSASVNGINLSPGTTYTEYTVTLEDANGTPVPAPSAETFAVTDNAVTGQAYVLAAGANGQPTGTASLITSGSNTATITLGTGDSSVSFDVVNTTTQSSPATLTIATTGADYAMTEPVSAVLSASASTSYTFVTGPAAAVSISGPAQVLEGNSATYSAQVTDINGNPVPASGNITFSLVAPTSVATLVNGQPGTALQWAVTSAFSSVNSTDWLSYYPDVTNGDTYTFSITMAGTGDAMLNVWDGNANLPANNNTFVALSSTPITEEETVTIPSNAPTGQTGSAPQIQVVVQPGTTVDVLNASVVQQGSTQNLVLNPNGANGTTGWYPAFGGQDSTLNTVTVSGAASVTVPLNSNGAASVTVDAGTSTGTYVLSASTDGFQGSVTGNVVNLASLVTNLAVETGSPLSEVTSAGVTVGGLGSATFTVFERNGVDSVVTPTDTLQVTVSNPSDTILVNENGTYVSGSSLSLPPSAFTSGAAMFTVLGGNTGTATVTVSDSSNPDVPSITFPVTVQGLAASVITAAGESGNGNVPGDSATISINGSTASATYASAVSDFAVYDQQAGELNVLTPSIVTGTVYSGSTAVYTGDLAVWDVGGQYYYLALDETPNISEGAASNTDYVGIQVTGPTGSTVQMAVNSGAYDGNTSNVDYAYIAVATESNGAWSVAPALNFVLNTKVSLPSPGPTIVYPVGVMQP
ncbi:MAG: Ig-like domain-containing protein [Firmicutes bacterium]|nr:Ig-like domain-containing protein [Bacillota bacterium]